MKKSYLLGSVVMFIILFCAIIILIQEERWLSLTSSKEIKDTSNETETSQLPAPILLPEQPNRSIPLQSTNDFEQQLVNQQIDQLLTTLTLQQKIGQLLIFGIDDNKTEASKQTKQLIEEQGIGNIILFKRNIKSSAQLSELIHSLKTLPLSHEIPLWISIDQEGGKVNRLPQQFPAAQYLAELDNASATKQAGQEIGQVLEELGIDINFAPVLDINNNPDNPVIGSRAFGSDAQSVVKHSMAMLDGLDDYVLTVGKHFPGHGDTNVDSHYSLPIIDKSWEELETLELIPFRAAIEQHIDAIMVGHLYLPQIDEHYPASLSHTIITHYLREQLGFEGIIVTDDLVMGGITEHYDIGEAAVLALQAGNTMLIVGHEPKQQQAVIEAMMTAVQLGILSEELINEKVALVLNFKINKKYKY